METNIPTGFDNGNGNLLIAQLTSLPQTATLQSLSFYVDSPAGQLRLGVYDASGPNGGPGQKKAETNSFTPVSGWNTQNVITPVSLPAGTYWLSYLPSDSNLSLPVDRTSGQARYYSFAFATLPPTFSTAPSAELSHWSLYATLNVSTTLSGDLNADGSVNALDLQLEVNVILGTNTDPTVRARADLNGDSAVNALDLQMLVNKVLGL